jgi:CDP-diacylglycerol--glycerol-3-phosphate 3-phosphatidyltransferase
MMSMRGLEGELIALLVSSCVGAVLVAYAVRAARFGRASHARLDSLRGTPFLGRYPIEAFHWAARALGVVLARKRVSPDALTLSSLALTALTAPLAASGHFEAAGAVLLFGSAFDVLDGIVARERGVASEAGEILDSVLDRYADALCLMGLAIFYRQSAWRLTIVLITLFGAMMVSYVRAKAEKFALSLPSTVMRRPERVAYVAMGLLLGPLVSSWIVPFDETVPATLAVVALVGVVSNLAAVKLLVSARTDLDHRRLRASALLTSARKALQADAAWPKLTPAKPRNDVLLRNVDDVAVPLPLRLAKEIVGHESGGIGGLGGHRVDLFRVGTSPKRPTVERAPPSPGRLLPRRRRRRATS